MPQCSVSASAIPSVSVLSVRLPIRLSVFCQFVCQSVCLSIRPSINVFVCQCVRLSVNPAVIQGVSPTSDVIWSCVDTYTSAIVNPKSRSIISWRRTRTHSAPAPRARCWSRAPNNAYSMDYFSGRWKCLNYVLRLHRLLRTQDIDCLYWNRCVWILKGKW